MYKHKPLYLFKVGDLVEFNAGYGRLTGTILQITSVDSAGQPIIGAVSQRGWNLNTKAFNLLDTLPGSTAKIGDIVCCIQPTGRCKVGNTFSVAYTSNSFLYPGGGVPFGDDISNTVWCWSNSNFVVLQEDTTVCYFNTLKEPTMNIQAILSQLFGNEKPTTDYDKRPAYLVVAYSRNGSELGTTTAPSIQCVKDKVANEPLLWGCKVLIYTLDKEVSVTVPVSIDKAKAASAIEQEAE